MMKSRKTPLKTKVLAFRITPEDYARLARIAREEAEHPSTTARHLLRAALALRERRGRKRR